MQWKKIAVKSRLQKVIYIVTASINRLNDQLPRDYNKGRCYVPGYRPRSGLLTVMCPGVRLRSGLFTIVYPGVRPRSGLLDVAYPGVRARRGLLDVVQPGVRARWPVDRCVPGFPVPFTVWTNNDVVKSTNFSLMTTQLCAYIVQGIGWVMASCQTAPSH